MSFPYRLDLPPLPVPDDLADPDAGGASWTSTVAIVVAGMLVGVLAQQLLSGTGTLPDLGEFFPGLGPSLVLLLGGAFLALPVHEAGHLLGGWLVGFRFCFFIAGPVRVVRDGSGIALRWNRNLSLYGGLAASIPTDARDLTRRHAWMVASGPLTSVASGGASLALATILFGSGSGPGSVGEAALLLGLLTFGASSILIGLVTLIPATTSGFPTDGAQLLRAWRDHPATDRNAAVLALTGLQYTTRPREWSPDLVARAVETTDGSLHDVEGHRFAFLHAIDRGDVETARDHLQTALDRYSRYPESARDGLFSEAAFFEAAVRQDVDAARGWLDRVGSDPNDTFSTGSTARAHVALARANGTLDEETLAAAREAVRDHAAAGLAEADRDWIAAIAERPDVPSRDAAASAADDEHE